MNDTIKFSHNWNNKLDCHAFTTIRLYNSTKHVPGKKYTVILKDKQIGTATIKAVTPFLVSALNSYVTYLDTGYSVEECTAILHKMYPSVDFTTTRFALILLVKAEKKEPVQKELFTQQINK